MKGNLIRVHKLVFEDEESENSCWKLIAALMAPSCFAVLFGYQGDLSISEFESAELPAALCVS